MRKPVDLDEAMSFYSVWRRTFDKALDEAMASMPMLLIDVVEHAADAQRAVRNAAIVADLALEKMVEKYDELRASTE